MKIQVGRVMMMVVGCLALASPVRAQYSNGTWNADLTDFWGTATRWTGVVPSGQGSTANVGTVDITAHRSITLEVSRTIGHLIFADATTASHDWFLAPASASTVLTLEHFTSGTIIRPTINVTNRSVFITTPLAGTNGFVKLGGGILVLSNETSTASTLTGQVQVVGGILQVANEASLGTPIGAYWSAAILISNNATLMNARSPLLISANRGITLGAGGGTLRTGWGMNWTNLSVITGSGALSIGSDPNPGAVVLAAANTYTGDTIIQHASGNNTAILRLGANEVIPDGAGRGNLTVHGSLNLAGFNETVNGLWGAGWITNSEATASTLTVGGNNQSSMFAGGIRGPISVVKTGAGDVRLVGTNLFTGSVTVNAGVLGLLGTIGTASVASAGTLAIGPQNRATNLAAQTTTVDGALQFKLRDPSQVGNGVNDFFETLFGNALTFNSGSRLDLVPMAGFQTGTYTVATSGGALSGVANLTPVTASRYTFSIAQNGFNVEVTASGSASNLVWRGINPGVGTGVASADWDLTNVVNFAQNQKFFTGDTVLFDDSAVKTIVNLIGDLMPAAVVVNSTSNYTFTGSGRLTGATGLTKDGSGTLFLNTTNDYMGATIVQGGVLRPGNTGAVGHLSVPIVVTNGGTFDVGGLAFSNRVLYISGAGVGGTGAVVNTGGGQNDATRTVVMMGDTTVGGTGRWDIRSRATGAPATLSTLGQPWTLTKVGPNMIALISVTVDTALGEIQLKEGDLRLESGTSASLGNQNLPITIWSNARLSVYNLSTALWKQIVMRDGAIFEQAGPSGGVAFTNRGSIVLSNGLARFTSSAGTLETHIYGPMTGAGGFVKDSVNIMRLFATNTYQGPTIVSGGVLVVAANASIRDSSEIHLLPGTRLLLDNTVVNASNRLGDATVVRMMGGTFEQRYRTNEIVVESVGTLSLEGGVNALILHNQASGSGGGVSVTFANLQRSSGILSVTNLGIGALGGGVSNSANPLLWFGNVADGVLLPYVVQHLTNFTRYSTASGVVPLAFGTLTEFDGSASQTGLDTRFSTTRTGVSDALTADRSVASLTIAPTNSGLAAIDLAGNNLTISGGGVLLTLPVIFSINNSGGSGSITGTDPIFIVSSANATMWVNAVVSAGTLSKEGVGTMVLTGPNTYSGGTIIGAGVLQVGSNSTSGTLGTGAVINNGTLRFFRSDDIAFAENISGNGRLQKYGAGTLTLSGQNSYTNATEVFAGTLSVSAITDDNTGQLGPSVPTDPGKNFLELYGGTRLRVTGTGTSRTERTVWLDNTGIATIEVAQATGVVIFEGRLRGAAAQNNWLTGPGTVVFAGTGDNDSFNITISGGTAVLAKAVSGSTIRALSQNNTNLNAVILLDGTGDDQLVSTANLHMSGGVFDLNGRAEGWNNLTGTGWITNRSTAPAEFTLGQNGGTATNFVNIVDGPGTVAFRKAGSGAVTLAGTNAFSGGTIVTGGTLVVGSPWALGGTNPLQTWATVDLNGFTQAVSSIAGSRAARVLNAGVAPSLLVVGGGNANSLNWAGNLIGSSGLLSLQKIGTGVASLPAVGTNQLYSVEVLGGRLALDSAPTALISVAAGAEIALVGRYHSVTAAPGTKVFLGAAPTNAGVVTLAGGDVILTGAGLFEGRTNVHSVSLLSSAANPKQAVRLGPSYGQTTITGSGGFPDTSTYMYTGFLYIPGPTNVTWTFAENFDDSVRLVIDGIIRITNGIAHNVATWATVELTPGYHSFEVAFGQGSGGVGPSANWPFGFGYDPQGRGESNEFNYSMMVDPGDGSMFIVSTSSYAIASPFNVQAGSVIQLKGPPDVTLSGPFTNAGVYLTLSGTNGQTLTMSGPHLIQGPTVYHIAGVGFTSVVSSTLTMTSPVPLVKTGPGALVLPNPGLTATFVMISNGLLQIGTGGAPSSPMVSGPVTNMGLLAFNHSNAQTVDQPIYGSGGLIKAGTGFLNLINTNAFTGGILVSGGTLRLGHSNIVEGVRVPTTQPITNLGAIVEFAMPGFLISSNVFVGTGTIRQQGSDGLLQLTQDSPDFFGNWEVRTGALWITKSYALGAHGTGTVFVNYQSGGLGSRALWMSGNIGVTGKVIQTSGTGFSNTLGVIRSVAGTNAWVSTINMTAGAGSSRFAADAGAGLILHGVIFPSATGRILQLDGAGMGILRGVISNGIMTDLPILKEGPGIWTIAAQNQAGGWTFVSNGVLRIGEGGTVGNLGSGVVTNRTQLWFDRSDVHVVTNEIRGAGTLAQIGSGTTVLTFNNPYTGPTIVSNGALRIQGAHTGGGLITVVGGRLEGNGSVAGAINVLSGGTLAPGSSAGIFTANANVTLQSGAFFEVELNGTTPGTLYDQLLMGTGTTLTLSNPTLSVILGFTPSLGDTFQIVSGFSTLSGTFSGLPSSGSTFNVGSTQFQIDYNASDITLTVIPEPSTLGLVGMIAAGILLRRRLR
ncbi:MAG: autotransporter-associated beta strand repeat-containing protein [Kiritimatiellae bacterium]|nr:autotransporter-associated beta strand repeat-containing protein [Kiritimatiellia bacterium]